MTSVLGMEYADGMPYLPTSPILPLPTPHAYEDLRGGNVTPGGDLLILRNLAIDVFFRLLEGNVHEPIEAREYPYSQR